MARTKKTEATKEARGNQEFNQFLRASDIGNSEGDSATLVLTGFNHFRPNGTYGPEWVVEVKNESGKFFDFSIREGSPNHRKLFRTFGSEPARWKGNIEVNLQRSNQDRLFVNIIGRAGEDVPF